jgi:purine-nucleoside phosphorylase
MTIPPAIRESGVETAIVLGSGLGFFTESVPCGFSLEYSAIEGMPASSVPGHAGRFVLARLGSKPLLIAQGRVHLYEGWSAGEVVRHIQFMHKAGIRRIILTNAAGSLNPLFEPGSWMSISDHINLTGESPLRGGPNFFDMSNVYSQRLRGIFTAAARDSSQPLHHGVYAAMPGPQFETPAEIRMLSRLGADAVGMSTVHEAIQASALGMEVAGISCLTNWAAGLSPSPLSYEEVTIVGQQSAGGMVELIHRALPAI